VGSGYVFFHDFPRLQEVVYASGSETTATLLGYVFPFLFALGMVSSTLWVVAALGLHRARPWTPGVVAATALFGMIATFMPIPPTAGRGHLFPSTLVMALPAFVAASFVTARWSLRLPWKVVGLGAGGVFAGLLCFINGTAAAHRLLDGHGLVYLVTGRLHWVLVFGWLSFVVSLFSRHPRTVSIGISVAAACALLGFPVFAVDAIFLGRFSLFGVSPLWTTFILAVLMLGRRGSATFRKGGKGRRRPPP